VSEPKMKEKEEVKIESPQEMVEVNKNKIKKEPSLVEKNIKFFNTELSKTIDEKDKTLQHEITVGMNDTMAIEASMERNILTEEKKLGMMDPRFIDQSTILKGHNCSGFGGGDRISQDSLFHKVISQVQEKNKSDKYNFKAFKNKKISNENILRNMIESSNNVLPIPESMKESISTSMSTFSIEKQNAQIEIINTSSTKKDTPKEEKPKQVKSMAKNTNNFGIEKAEKLSIESSSGKSKEEETPKEPKIVLNKKIGNGLTLNDDLTKKANYESTEFKSKQQDIFDKSKTTNFFQKNNKENKQPEKKTNDMVNTISRKERERALTQKSKSQLFAQTTKRHNNYLDSNIDRKKNVDNEIDLGFMPQDMLYADKATYGESSINLLAAIEILEKAQDNKNKLMKNESPQVKSFWSVFNPFQCGNYN